MKRPIEKSAVFVDQTEDNRLLNVRLRAAQWRFLLQAGFTIRSYDWVTGQEPDPLTDEQEAVVAEALGRLALIMANNTI